MLDVSVAYNRYGFLGCEFLTWLWYVIENHPDDLAGLTKDFVALEFGNRLVLENRSQDTVETVTIKGDEPGLEEGMMALKKGAGVVEMNLGYRSGDHQWQFTLKGESLHITNLKVPDTGAVESSDDIEGAVLEKVYLYEKVFSLVDAVFKRFIEIRISDAWPPVITQIRQWIAESG